MKKAKVRCELVAALSNPKRHSIGSWYLRFESPGNHETLFVSETYATKSNARRAARKLGLEAVEVPTV